MSHTDHTREREAAREAAREGGTIRESETEATRKRERSNE